MGQRVLITGGAGFIGSHLGDELVRAGYDVRALDNLDGQVHGSDPRRPPHLHPDVELLVGDVRDDAQIRAALSGVDFVVHLAAAVGVGQSMYQMARYTVVNCVGTAVLLEALDAHPVERLVVASSMSVYGEGRYVDESGNVHDQVDRSIESLVERRWDPCGPDGRVLRAVPTPEDKPPRLTSLYALTKLHQEQMCLINGRARRRPTVALRLFNTYGTRQALSNPYTGVLANFASRLLHGRPPIVFEDGNQLRDFVHVADVARAFRLALSADADQGVFNIGSGRPCRILEIAERVGQAVGVEVAPEVTGQHRVGDVRHCTADITRAETTLGYRAWVSLDTGLAELADWLASETVEDRSDAMRDELERHGGTW